MQNQQQKTSILVAVTNELNENIALITPDDFQTLKSNFLHAAIVSPQYLTDTNFLYDDSNTNASAVHVLETKLLDNSDASYFENDHHLNNQIDLLNNFEENFLFFERDSSELENAVPKAQQLNINVMEAVKPITENQNIIIDNQSEIKIDFEQERKEDFSELQLNDATLKSCWDDLKKDDSKFFVNETNKLLFRTKKLAGISVSQLVVPKVKRDLLLSQSHTALAASHLGIDKTMQRLSLYYFWPNIKKDVANYVGSCQACQRRFRISRADKVKIKPMPRSQIPFQDISMDLIGELDPPSSAGHKYILVIVDNFSRWIEGVPLKSLRAQEVCEGLLEVFSRTSFPNSIQTDNGTNFTAQLSRDLYKLLGIKIKFCSPYHPEGNSQCERANQVSKKLLHSIAVGPDPRSWHTKLKYLLASFREVPNRITGISPYQLVYGRVGKGPMSVLKDIWMKEQNAMIEKVNEDDFLVKLKNDLAAAAELANSNSDKNQKIYIDHYNRLAKNKTFVTGQQVLVLLKDSTNKLRSRWRGPNIITAVLSENSYRVLMEDGGSRNFHANHLRHYKPRVNNMV